MPHAPPPPGPQRSGALAATGGRPALGALRPATPLERALLGLVSIAAAAVLALAFRLDPAGVGYGTHTQLGLAPCIFRTALGLPCPACGLTTSFAHLAHGAPWSSVSAHPLGFLLALLLAATVPLSAIAAWRGITPARLAAALRLGAFALGLSILFMLAWMWRLVRMLLA